MYDVNKFQLILKVYSFHRKARFIRYLVVSWWSLSICWYRLKDVLFEKRKRWYWKKYWRDVPLCINDGNVGHMDKRLLLNLPPHDVAHQCNAMQLHSGINEWNYHLFQFSSLCHFTNYFEVERIMWMLKIDFGLPNIFLDGKKPKSSPVKVFNS